VSEWKKELCDALKSQAYASRHGKCSAVSVDPRAQFPEEVEYVQVQLFGVDMLTGEKIIKNAVLNRGRSVQFGNLILDGKVRISYRAKLSGKSEPEQFMGDEYIELSNPERRPKARITEIRKKGDFTKVTLKANCWPTIEGKIWLKYNGRYQAIPIPKKPQQEIELWLPTSGEIELILPPGVGQN